MERCHRGGVSHVLPSAHVASRLPGRFERYLLSCNYGIVNPCSAGLWGLSAGVWYRMREYYYDAKAQNAPYRTDEEHYRAIEALCGGLPVEEIVLDPSAKSLMETIKSHGRFRPIPADNGVLPGIRAVTAALEQGKILIGEGCRDAIREFSLYRWEENAGTKDQAVKAGRPRHGRYPLFCHVRGPAALPDGFFARAPRNGHEAARRREIRRWSFALRL